MREASLGDYLNEWVRREELPGEDGVRRHLMFGVVVGADENRCAVVDDDATTACGLPVVSRWSLDDSSPKCERCRQIADGDGWTARARVPQAGDRDPVPA